MNDIIPDSLMRIGFFPSASSYFWSYLFALFLHSLFSGLVLPGDKKNNMLGVQMILSEQGQVKRRIIFWIVLNWSRCAFAIRNN